MLNKCISALARISTAQLVHWFLSKMFKSSISDLREKRKIIGLLRMD
jgi:hypothetical protein